jgi:adenosylcobinamide-GDP ribazoletransferase
LGVAIAFLDRALCFLLPTGVASVLLVLTLLLLTGALHLDGLADTADGFFSSQPRSGVLEIMKDPHIGSMGVAAVAGLLILKVTLFTAIPPSPRFSTLVLTPTLGRSAMVWMMQILPYAREQGTGLAFARRPAWSPLLASTLIPPAAGFFLMGWEGVLVCFACAVAAGCLALGFHRRIGGWTGDTLGAAGEIVEVLPALVAVARATGSVA